MLTRNERVLVEAIRRADTITIIVPGDGRTGDGRIRIQSKTVSHDVAIALQTHFNNCGVDEADISGFCMRNTGWR